MDVDRRISWIQARRRADEALETRYELRVAKRLAKAFGFSTIGEVAASRRVEEIWNDCSRSGESTFLPQLRAEELIPVDMFVCRGDANIGIYEIVSGTGKLEAMYAKHVRPHVPAGALVFPLAGRMALDKDWVLHTLYDVGDCDGVTVTHRSSDITLIVQPLGRFLQLRRGDS